MKRPFYARYSLPIMLAVVFVLPFALSGARRALLSNRNDVGEWLPARYEETTTFKWFRRHFAGEEFILVSWEGSTLDDKEGRLRLFVDKLVPPAGAGRASGEPRLFKEVMTGRQTLEKMTSPPINLSDEEALARLKGSLIGPDLRQTCVVLTLSEAGRQNIRQAVGKIRSTAVQECGIPLAKLHMGGPPVDNVAIDEAGEQSLYRLAGLAGVIGLLISWWCLRSGRLIAMVFTAGIYSSALSLAMVWYSGYSMNAILLTMPSLVYVAAISGAIHLSNYYRDELGGGAELAGAPERAIRHAALPLSLATLTTSVGLLTLCYSELVPIQLFGFFSAIGVVGSALLLFFFLPSAFQLWPLRGAGGAARPDQPRRAGGDGGQRRGLADPLPSRRWRMVGHTIIRRQGWVALGCLAILGGCAYGMTRIQTSVHLMRLFPPDAKILADYRWLETHLGELVPMEIVLRIDPDKCRLNFLERMELVSRIQERVNSIDQVGSSLSAVTFAPRLPRPEDFKNPGGILGTLQRIAVKRQYETARTIYNQKLSEHRDEYLEEAYLAEEDGHDLWRISARVGALQDVDYGRFLREIEQQVEPVLRAQQAQGVQGIQAIYTGLVPLVYKAQRSLLDGLVIGFVTDFVLIIVVMMIAVRDWSAGLILALPSIFPAVTIFGLMGWLGIVVDIGTVMAPAVALGVTVDDVVHFMIKYRGGLKAGLSRRQSIIFAYKGCARAMYQSWGVIGLGLSVFALSPFTPTQRFGYLMVTLLTAALVGNLLLLPALLAGPLGVLFGRRYTRRRKALPETAEPGARRRPAAQRLDSQSPVMGTEHARRSIRA